ncbi:MAG: FAD-dependent oxidoreductase [Spirochaetales bacterium]|nr:FAD-dependent oxidoreductase [Spirochaetales bacterium]MBP7263878.1 FAD-dependent oxidoreductase [Spirochaetia bacterium]
MNRIDQHPVIDQKPPRKTVEFLFDGAAMTGFEGEAVSSALFANGVKKFSEHAKDGAPQGIFCANGQCSQCSLIVDGILRKACVTPLRAGMDLRTVRGLPELPADDSPARPTEVRRLSCQVLVIGGGPSGLAAAAELAERGFDVILADDKEELGGKLVLQTHKFFGSEEDCYAGTRGYEIARILERKVRSYPNVRILANSPVLGVYKDRSAGVYEGYSRYILVDFQALVVAAGARERSLVFPGNDLPGVYGAGAFQTLVNRDLVRAARKVFVIGSGNVGLIGSYHALQAGIQVAGICEILPKVNGYKVHADKIIRMGVPIHLSTTVLSVEGDGKVERVTVAAVDKDWQPLLDTARTYEVDTVLVATGLSPCDEFYRQAVSFGFTAVRAGDAEEIAEASSAMFGGKIAALALAKMLGKDVSIDQAWLDKREVLKSRPGDIIERESVEPGPEWRPVFFCTEEIPCNPCTTVCPTHSIQLAPRKGSIMDLPYFHGTCKGCSSCVAACPGLAISLVRSAGGGVAEVQLPFEFDASAWEPGTKLPLLDQDGAFVTDGELVKKFYNKKYRTWVLTLKAPADKAAKVIGIRVQPEEATRPLPQARYSYLPDNAIVCRCERVTVGDIVSFIRENNVRDINQLKTIRVGMGACGSKTCSTLLPQVFRKAGVDPATVTAGTLRPLMLEAGMGELVNESSGGSDK